MTTNSNDHDGGDHDHDHGGYPNEDPHLRAAYDLAHDPHPETPEHERLAPRQHHGRSEYPQTNQHDRAREPVDPFESPTHP